MSVFSALARSSTVALLLFTAIACSEDPPAAGLPGDTGVAAFDTGSTEPADGAITDAAPGPDTGTDAGAGPGDVGIDPRDPNNSRRDTDCDGLSDAYELSTVYPDGNRTDPANPDSDGDGISDGVEAGVTGGVTGASCSPATVDADPSSRTSPTSPDHDGDGIPDGLEDRDRNGRTDAGETDPRLRDTDGDGIADGVEDTNRNGTVDAGETNPTLRDSDGDGIADGLEDANRNGAVDAGETDPRNTDSDGDGLLDGDEDTDHDGVRASWESDPRSSDTDCDGLSDAEEIAGNTSPLVPDSDRDGVLDGVESGRTMAVAGSSCPGFTADADPASTTPADVADTDGDGLPDGVEDANQNGRVDAGESNPNDADSDDDGLTDGEEVDAGTDPANPNSPTPLIGDGIRAVCSTANLLPVDFDVGAPGAWTIANPPALSYTGLTVNVANVRAAALDGAASGVAAFVLERPLFPGSPSAADQTAALINRLAAQAAGQNLTLSVRQSGRSITSHDAYESTVSTVLDVASTSGVRDAAGIRASLLALAAELGLPSFGNLPGGTGAAVTNHVGALQVLVRPADGVLLIVGGVIDRARYDDPTDGRAIALIDLTNGTALARPDAGRGRGCDPFEATGISVADFIWMADISASTDDDRGRIVSAAQQVFDALSNNNVDFRMAVVPHSQSTIHQPTNAGNLRGVGFTRDRAAFASYLQDVSGTDGCEFGLDAVNAAITRALPRSAPNQENPQRIRGNATLAVVYVGDEHAQEVEEGPCFNLPQRRNCPTAIGDVYTGGVDVCSVTPPAPQQACVDQLVAPYITTLRREGGIAFGQIFNPNPVTACNTNQLRCAGSAQDRNEGGRGYVEVISATGGIFYSPCEANPGAGSLQAIVDAVSGAASQFQLQDVPVSATLKVGVTRAGAGGAPMTTIVPRDRQSGFDYDPVSNSIFFRGTQYRPLAGDRVTVSYRVWRDPPAPCGGPCPPGQVCLPELQVCGCDAAQCAANCGPGAVCGADCTCSCAADCGGACGPNQVCNQGTCQCECPADCGGCPSGTTCNPNSCACECGADCGGACGGAGTNLACDGAACACVCPADCGGACAASGGVCNPSTCGCDCAPDCDASCQGNAVCNPANGCGCECPIDCGGCPDNTVCNSGSCQCECPAGCNQNCPNLQVCDPNNGCGCFCPTDCGGCNANETCDPVNCICRPIV